MRIVDDLQELSAALGGDTGGRGSVVTIAPSSSPSSVSRIPRSSGTSLRSTSSSGAAIRAFITLTSVCPPASARAFGFAASSEIASSRERGRAYSTLARSIAVLYAFGLRRRNRNQRARPTIKTLSWLALISKGEG